jgi:hypothetical protein
MPRSANRWTEVFIYAFSLILLGSALVYVRFYGTNVPSWDDWDMVPTMTHHQPITASWLWSQHNEHRIPLARLLMLGTYRIWPDLRACMYLNVLAMGVISFALTRSARRIRGKPIASDIIFPLVLLGFAQGLNFIWAWQVEFFASTVVALCILILIAEYKNGSEIRTAILVSICLALLVISGAHGLALVPALAAWLPVLASLPATSNRTQHKRNLVILLSLCGFLAVLVVLYFVGFRRVPYFPTSPSAAHTLETALQFLTMAFGPAVKVWWPFSGLGMAAVLIAVVISIGAIAFKEPEERARAVGLLLFIAAMTTLALAVGLGRNGFEPRYVTLSVPIVCCIYLIASIYCPRHVRPYALLSLLAIPCLGFWVNTQSGLKYGRSLRSELGSFEQGMVRGLPPYRLVHAHLTYLHPNVQLVNDYLPMLRGAQIGDFRFLRSNPHFKQIDVPLQPTGLWHCTWKDGTARTTSFDAYVDFAVPKAIHAAGIHVTYTVENKAGTPPFFSIAWRQGSSSAFTTDRSYSVWPTGDRANWERGSWVRIGEPQTEMNLWVCDRVEGIRIIPDLQPCVFRLSELKLLVDPNQSNEVQHHY